MLTGSKRETPAPAAQPQPCDLRGVLDKTLDMLELQLGDAQVRLVKDYAESAEEVLRIAPGTGVLCVRGLTDERFYVPRDQGEARRDLGLPAEGPVVIVSGGGWAVGDLEGAAEEALEVPGATVVCLCGRKDDLRERLAERFGGEPRVRLEGFTDRMPDWFAAADVLVHSTAGLTVLEAIMRGCGVVSYGWGRGHVRANNAAFSRFGLAEVASSRDELPAALERAMAARPAPGDFFAKLPSAASAVLGLADGELGDGRGARQQAGADHNRAVSQVESRPLILPDVEQQKVHYPAAYHAIPQVAQRAAQNERQTHAGSAHRVAVFPEKCGHDYQRHNREQYQHSDLPL